MITEVKTHEIDGVTYVEVDRKAAVGDYVLIVNAAATNGMYKNGDIIVAEKVNEIGIFNEKVRSATDFCYNPNGYIDDFEYIVLEQVATVDTSQASEQVIEMFAALSRKIVSLEQQLTATQRNLEHQAEELENAKHRISKHATMFGAVEEKVEMLTDDIVTLDERSQILSAINKYYAEGSR